MELLEVGRRIAVVSHLVSDAFNECENGANIIHSVAKTYRGIS
jgi:hypothetical protein